MRFRVPLNPTTESTFVNFQDLLSNHPSTTTINLLHPRLKKHTKTKLPVPSSTISNIAPAAPTDEADEADEAEEADSAEEADPAAPTFDFDNLDFDNPFSTNLQGHGSANMTSVIERIERSYANPLWMAPLSDDEYDDQPLENLLHTGDEGTASASSASSSSASSSTSTSTTGTTKNKKKRKRFIRGVDFYDEDDSFIDDSELLAEKEEAYRQKSTSNKHSGFYVNSGQIDLDADSEVDDETVHQPRKKRTGTGTGTGTGAGAHKKRKIVKTGNARNDFISQHLGVPWNGHTALLQREMDTFTTLALDHMEHVPRRLPDVLEQPLEQLDVLVRTSTGKKEWRPSPYIAALLRALPGFGKMKVNQTLKRLEKRSVAREHMREFAAARAHFAMYVAEQLTATGGNKEDASDLPPFAWDPAGQLLLYKAVSTLKVWIEKENLYRAELNTNDTKILGHYADEYVDVKKEKKLLLSTMLLFWSKGPPSSTNGMTEKVLREQVALGKKVFQEEQKSKSKKNKKKKSDGSSSSSSSSSSNSNNNIGAAMDSSNWSKAMKQQVHAYVDAEGPRYPKSNYWYFQLDRRKADPPVAEDSVGKDWKNIDDHEKRKYDALEHQDQQRFSDEYGVFIQTHLNQYVAELQQQHSEQMAQQEQQQQQGHPAGGTASGNNDLLDAPSKRSKAEDKLIRIEREKKIKLFKKQNDAPKGPKNSFMMYALPRRVALKLEQPDLSGKVGDISTLIGQEWRTMSDQDKEVFQKMALDDKERYEKAMVLFQPSIDAFVKGGMVLKPVVRKKPGRKKQVGEGGEGGKRGGSKKKGPPVMKKIMKARVPLKSNEFAKMVDFKEEDFVKKKKT